MNKAETCPINETTTIDIEIPENISELHDKFIGMTYEQKNELLKLIAQGISINPQNKTFKTVNSKISDILTERLKQQKE